MNAISKEIKGRARLAISRHSILGSGIASREETTRKNRGFTAAVMISAGTMPRSPSQAYKETLPGYRQT